MAREQSPKVWDEFWAGKDPATIYPPVTNILDELTCITQIKNKKILEVGAGTGRDSLKMVKAGAEVHVLDYSQESLKLVLSNIKDNKLQPIRADAQYCPFRDNSFDIIFHQGLLEHFKSPFPLLRENYRLLKKDGLLVVDVPQTFHMYTLIKQILIVIGLWFGGWERQFTLDSLARLLRLVGFEPLHHYGDWSRPGILYKIVREILKKIGITLPMYPRFFGRVTQRFYEKQRRLRGKKLLLYTVLSIGIIAQKVVK